MFWAVNGCEWTLICLDCQHPATDMLQNPDFRLWRTIKHAKWGSPGVLPLGTFLKSVLTQWWHAMGSGSKRGGIPINENLRFCLDLSDSLILYSNSQFFIKEIGDMQNQTP